MWGPLSTLREDIVDVLVGFELVNTIYGGGVRNSTCEDRDSLDKAFGRCEGRLSEVGVNRVSILKISMVKVLSNNLIYGYLASIPAECQQPYSCVDW